MRHFDLVIIGTGSGNSLPDERFADWDIAIVEKGVFGGTCLNVGCIPTKMFVHTADVASAVPDGARLGVDAQLTGVRWTDVRDRIFGRIDPIAEGGRRYRVEDNPNVTVYAGQARFVGPKTLDTGTGEVITADRFVLAAGGRPVVPDVVDLAQVGYHTSDTIMRLDELPRRMVILGSGFVAAEFAHVFSSFGVEVTVVARSDRLLRAEDTDISTRFTELAQQRWDVRLRRKAVRAERVGGLTRLHLEGPDGAEVAEGEVLLVAVGRRPNSDLLDVAATGVTTHPDGRVVVDAHQSTVVDGIWALGDISSPYQLKHVANHEARVVQHNLLHPEAPVAVDHRFVPAAVFSHPQVASVGLTEQQAVDQGVRYVTATQDFAGVAYGWALEDTASFVKLLADPATGHLLGAHIIGPQASTLIQPLIQAMSFGLDARSMARGQYWIHPGLPEAVENALLNLPLD
ncbi:mycothione reductase [Goodfellowiella coeruleoviolacea]|uniref:Mycothione reductase n=1 Tax=Goodfellowiella coeruleoviolacea TaxID=334858 RepID=A0AAE3GLT9_9PSEU|nr:mycothione reductase [Goodfellowiella coeruleoviolacea]MCP2169659.1 mycothione reductase [Goodfellowiella coeruleoviolacea]